MIMMKKLLEHLLVQYKKLIIYGFCGVLTTVVIYAVYFAFTNLF